MNPHPQLTREDGGDMDELGLPKATLNQAPTSLPRSIVRRKLRASFLAEGQEWHLERSLGFTRDPANHRANQEGPFVKDKNQGP